MNNNDWKRQLNAILLKHNEHHATRGKVVSHSTMEARQQGLFRAFTLLRELGYKPVPRNLSGSHVLALMRYWTGLPAAKRGAVSPPAPLVRPHSPAYIQQQLSFLRVFAGWIGKPGMVRTAGHYVEARVLVARDYTARVDKGWTGNGVDIEHMIEAVALIDPRVAVQLRLMSAFGLRRKEAVMFHPHAAEVPAHALPEQHRAGDRYLAFLRVKRGTKGGRLRYTAVRTEAQRRALEEARALARHAHSHIGHPDLTLKQALDLFSNVVRSVGLTKRELGVTPHGLRHEFAGDLFFELASVQAPVRGGDPCADRATLEAAYLDVARQLGHNRTQIGNAYLGSPARPRAAGVGGAPAPAIASPAA